MNEECMVFFQADNCDLNRAIKMLESYKFNVLKSDEKLIVSDDNDLQFQIVMVTDEFIQEEAKEISEHSKYSKEMGACDARFEIVIEDFAKAIDEMNTLIEIQGALQDASKGYLFTPWNGNIIAPWLG